MFIGCVLAAYKLCFSKCLSVFVMRSVPCVCVCVCESCVCVSCVCVCYLAVCVCLLSNYVFEEYDYMICKVEV